MRLFEVSKKYGITCGNHTVRPASAATCGVLHQTGGSTAEGAASYLSTRPDGSVHCIVDNTKAFMTAPIRKAACGVRDVNYWTWHVEQAGPFSWNIKDWKKNVATIRRAAWHMARFLVRQDLPRRFLSTTDLNQGARRGWTVHSALSYSTVSSSTHVDPVHYPLPLFKFYLRRFYRRFERNGVPHLKVVS